MEDTYVKYFWTAFNTSLSIEDDPFEKKRPITDFKR